MSVSDRSRKTREPAGQPRPETRWRTVRDGLVGGTVSAALSFLPLSEVLAALLADLAGAVAGLVAFLPYLLGRLL